MYSRLSIVMFPILLVVLIGAGMWGYLEHQEKNAILIKAENQYQRAFHDLSFHVDSLHTELGNTLALNTASQDSYKKGLINVWRITSEAQNEINQLPLTLLPFNKTEEFLANMSNFSYRAALRDLGKQPLNEQEMQTLNALYQHANEISTDLRGMQSKVLANNLRWMDVETALATQKEPLDNAIIDGFQTVDKKVADYADVKWSPSVMSTYQAYDAKMLTGNDVSAEDVRQKAAKFLNIADSSAVKVVENGAGTEFESYSVTAPKDNIPDGTQMDYSHKGGELLWYSAARDVPDKKLDIRGARDAAAEFLDTHGYPNMTAVSYDEYNNVANITFASRMNDVINFIDKVAVKIAMDNGDVTGLQATDYVYNHKERQLNSPKLSAEEARKVLNSQMQVDHQSLALIRNDLQEEVLCHEFTGRINGGVYRIYINAETGVEEKVEHLRKEEQVASQV
ncbi:germination protein YpeB [Paenibacillus sp. WQ 127069]|uniref:Germination protein YpeB n=1 Tax=Paenibacillus baimaensis TaxID=2982185 RepID=A0ABT2UMI3_9BACL|nr:germination protein YpeB [Paenibacillus sp. WQ 127069]MCU6795857.1 germination protein YpeB [Paenibacillus sp. WQ 127069]